MVVRVSVGYVLDRLKYAETKINDVQPQEPQYRTNSIALLFSVLTRFVYLV